MTTGVYTLIQYFHDRKRGEGVNVGVALLFAGEVRVQFASPRAIYRRFPEARPREGHIVEALKGLEHRLKSTVCDAESLALFASREVGELGLVRQKRAVVGAVPAALLQRLFDDLVGEPRRRTRHRATAPDVQKELLTLFRKPPPGLKTNIEVPVPGVPTKTLRIPVAYKNGANNYIYPQGFVADEEKALKAAQETASTGLLLSQERVDGQQQRLIVRANLEDPELEGEVADIFRRFGVDLYTSAHDLVARVESDIESHKAD